MTKVCLRKWLVLGFAGVVLGGSVAVSVAQAPIPAIDEPGRTVEQDQQVPDTDVSPKAKKSDLWQQVAGADFGDSEVIGGSATTFDTDLYAVSFRNSRIGFAGGAKCAVETAPEETSGCDEVSGSPAVSGRVPVVYRFEEMRNGDRVWERMDLDPSTDEEKPGYVGAIVWLDANTAIAVGGTGRYPKRDLSWLDAGASSYEQWLAKDPAGAGRAWRYEDGGWSELDLSEERAQGMRGLNAVAYEGGGTFGAAGGLGQIWELQGTEFTRGIDRDSDVGVLRNRRLFRGRVRAFTTTGQGLMALTAGCCEQSESEHHRRQIQRSASTGRWNVIAGATSPDPTDPERLRYTINDANTDRDNSSYKGIRRWCPGNDVAGDDKLTLPTGGLSCVPPCSLVLAQVPEPLCVALAEAVPEMHPLEDNGVQVGDDQDEPLYGPRRVSADQHLPDSYYARGLLSMGGPERDGEPSSVLEGASATDVRNGGRVRLLLSTARLVSADGDADGTNGQGNDVPDWSVGELRSTRIANLGAAGLAFATHLPRPAGARLNRWDPAHTVLYTLKAPPGDDVVGEPGAPPEVSGTDDAARPLEATYYRTPSYSLNAVDVVPDSGEAWAVGDHGAILSTAAGAAGGVDDVEPNPPILGDRVAARLPDDSAYEVFRSFGEVPAPGALPELWDAPREQRPQFGYQGLGTLGIGQINNIVMSRDGTEGFAFGASGIAHWDGHAWRPCHAAPGPADPLPPRGCPGADVTATAGSSYGDATRIPLERDRDPSNDDDFEVFATTTGPPVRYRDGEWRFEDEAALAGLDVTSSSSESIAFTAPDDGWVLSGRMNATERTQPYRFFRFDGVRWHDCYVPKPAGNADVCDAEPRLPQFPPGGANTNSFRQEGYATLQGIVRGITAAGDRVYAYGERVRAAAVGVSFTSRPSPFIVYREKGDPGWRAAGGGHDPTFGTSDPLASPSEMGEIHGLAVTQRPDGDYEGWATGVFAAPLGFGSLSGVSLPLGGTPLLRLDSGGSWRPFKDTGALSDYAAGIAHESHPASTAKPGKTSGRQMLMLPGSDAEPGQTFFGQSRGRMFHWNAERERFELPVLGREAADRPWSAAPAGPIGALAPDGRGGFFVSVERALWHWTDRPLREHVAEVPLPARDVQRRITALAGDGSGAVWASTNSEVLYRYDRMLGWGRVQIPGWDPGRVVTVSSRVNAAAVGPDGRGFAVGDGGRIARLSGDAAILDPAAGTACDLDAPAAPCGTGRDLHAVAVAADGSALAGGDGVALLWRPAVGDFRAVTRPRVAARTRITDIAMPSPERAWLATDRGLIFAGELSGGDWKWGLENSDREGEPRKIGPLHEIAVGEDGHGYALTEAGSTLLERTGDEEEPWRQVVIADHDGFSAVALVPGPSPGAVLSSSSAVLTSGEDGRFVLADVGGGAQELLPLPGREPGEFELWALEGRKLLHYASDRDDPLLSPAPLERPLPDAPGSRDGELTLAAFGRMDCQAPRGSRCHEIAGLNFFPEVIARRITEELTERRRDGRGPAVVLFTGDAVDSAGYHGNAVTSALAPQQVSDTAPHDTIALPGHPSTSAWGPRKLRRFSELVADRMADHGMPLFGAIGSRDVSELTLCSGFASCGSASRDFGLGLGENLAWRQAMAAQPAPWGRREGSARSDFEVRPVADGRLAQRLPDTASPDPDGAGPVPSRTAPTGGASTHYAVDLLSRSGGRAVARVVFVDSSLRSLAAADAAQQPAEGEGGQLAWLERMLCVNDGPAAAGCTRAPDQQAIVVSNTPTYSYGYGFGTDTAPDGTVLEALLMRHGTNLVVSGRIGWNTMYWASAPGVHTPCPGGEYPSEPPELDARACGGAAGSDGQAMEPSASGVESALLGLAAPAAPVTEATGQQPAALPHPLPFVIAGGGGGPLAGSNAPEGFWHGYTLVRLDASGDPRKTIVEQRPIYDWVAIEAQERTLRPGQRMTLRGFGRVPDGVQGNAVPLPMRLDRISGLAITHRYDVLLADPAKPWTPHVDANGDYVPVPAAVATVDRHTGLVRAGRGRDERTYAIGMLSIGDNVATYPLVFEPRRSFAGARQRLQLPGLPRAARAPAAQPPLRAADPLAPPPAQPPASPGSPFSAQTLQPPQPPALPSLPAATAAAPPPAPSLTPPPGVGPPPPPPSVAPQQQPQPLALGAKLQAVAIVPSVNPPAPPPVNPAPPAGGAARKEARQKQAAAARSEENATEGAGEAGENRGDQAPGPPGTGGAAMTRRDRNRPEPSFTSLARPEQASAWARGALYGGGLGLAALAFSATWLIGRPRSRRREPRIPAPAWNRRPRA